MANIRDLDLKLLVVFRGLFETQNVSRVAEQLSMSQSAVSGALKRLREVFGDPLFVRSSHGVKPTPRALELHEPVREVLERIETLVAPTEVDPATASLTCAISATDYSQHVVVHPLIKRLRETAPQIRVAVMPFEVADLSQKLAAGHIDLALTVPEFAPQDLPSRLLFHERYAVAVGADHPLVDQDMTLENLCAYDHALVSPMGGGFVGPVDRALEALGHRRRVAISMPSSLPLPGLLEDTDLVAFVPRRMLAGRNRIRTFDPPFEAEGFSLIAVWHRRTHLNPIHRWIRAQLVEVIAE